MHNVFKEQVKGKNKLTPRLLGVTKDGILRLDEKTKEIIETWPLESVNRWAATQNIFTIDVGECSKGFYSVQTTEGDKISDVVEKYVVSMNERNVGEEENNANQEYIEFAIDDEGHKENAHENVPSLLDDQKKQVCLILPYTAIYLKIQLYYRTFMISNIFFRKYAR